MTWKQLVAINLSIMPRYNGKGLKGKFVRKYMGSHSHYAVELKESEADFIDRSYSICAVLFSLLFFGCYIMLDAIELTHGWLRGFISALLLIILYGLSRISSIMLLSSIQYLRYYRNKN